MSICPTCGASLDPTASKSNIGALGGAPVEAKSEQDGVSKIFTHVPHPHIAKRKQEALVASKDILVHRNTVERFNSILAVKITDGVGTMWCAYVFAALALVSLPDAIRGGTPTLISWIAQTFLQLVLLSIIIVGQKVASEASDKRALDTYNDAEAVLHEAIQIQAHLNAQDKLLSGLVERVSKHTP